MKHKRILNVLKKEWRLLFTDVNSALLVTLLPVLIVGQGMLYVWLAVEFGSAAMLDNTMFQSALAKLMQALPAATSLPPAEQLQVLLLSQFNFFLLLIPTVVAVSVATFSIVDEKLSGSLEALLATPVRTSELLLGKALAGAIPALVITWVAAGVFLVVIAALGWGQLSEFVITANWFLSLLLLTPAVAVLSFLLGVVGSSRAKDAKSAQSISTIIILPVMGLIVIQVIGVVWFTPLLTVALTLGLGVIDLFVLRVAVRLFQRESIILQWH